MNQKVAALLNDQINKELYSAYLYLDMANFYTAKGLPFTYTIRGGELFVDRRSKSITISTVANALEKIVALEMDGIPITGPKKIGCYGASYLYPVLLALGIFTIPDSSQNVNVI